MADDQPNNLIIHNTADGKAKVALYAREGRVWLSQQQLAGLFATSVPNISMHIANVLEDKELSEDSVVKYFLTTAADGKEYKVAHYALEMIIAIGFRVRSKRGTQFRIWANQNLREYMVKGFVMDDERLKNRQDVTMDFWRGNVERLLAQNELPVLQDKGAVSHDQMEKLAMREYETYDHGRRTLEAERADQEDLNDLKALEDTEQKLKRSK